jgi:hypothetical protein
VGEPLVDVDVWRVEYERLKQEADVANERLNAWTRVNGTPLVGTDGRILGWVRGPAFGGSVTWGGQSG